MKNLSLVYHVKITKDEDGYTSSFRDINGAYSEGDTLEECLYNSQEAVEGVLLVMLDEGFKIPEPSQKKAGEHSIYVKSEIAAPVLLQQLRKKTGRTLADIANITGKPYQAYQRLENSKNMTLQKFDRAVAALGGTAELVIHFDKGKVANKETLAVMEDVEDYSCNSTDELRLKQKDNS